MLDGICHPRWRVWLNWMLIPEPYELFSLIAKWCTAKVSRRDYSAMQSQTNHGGFNLSPRVQTVGCSRSTMIHQSNRDGLMELRPPNKESLVIADINGIMNAKHVFAHTAHHTNLQRTVLVKL